MILFNTEKGIITVQMDALLNMVLLRNRYRNNFNLKLIDEEPDKNKYSYDLVKNFLLVELSRQAENELFKNRFITTFNFKYLNDHIMSYKIDYDKNIEEFEIQMIVYRDRKDINYTIYCNLYFDKYNIKYYINKIFIVGVNLKQRVNFDNLHNDYTKNYTNRNIPNPSDKKIESYKEDSEQFVKDEKKKRAQYIEDDRGYCFFKRNVQNKIQCESVDDNGTGVWDKSCVYNEDCPYFKRNRNYPNSRGGCMTDIVKCL